MQTREKSGQFVVPGERLGVIEEFMSGSGTYVEQDAVYSKTTGRVLLDVLNKEVSVYPTVKIANFPRTGSIVTGQVQNIQSTRAMLRIRKIEEKFLTGFFTGLLHISAVSQSFIESMFDACKAGDIMRAKVISDKNRTFQLSTADNELGVIYALCSQCGYRLELKGRNMLCTSCGKREKRKFAFDYGKDSI